MSSYEMRIRQWKITPNDWIEKDAQMGKECDENDENGLPNVNLPI